MATSNKAQAAVDAYVAACKDVARVAGDTSDVDDVALWTAPREAAYAGESTRDALADLFARSIPGFRSRLVSNMLVLPALVAAVKAFDRAFVACQRSRCPAYRSIAA